MKWRMQNRMGEKAAIDSKFIAEKEAQHKLVYHAQLHKKRLLGRYRMRNTGPREKMIIETNEPTLSIVIKGTFSY
jgi:hypothetical protein